MNTIIIPIFQGAAALSILRTDILKELRRSNRVRIVLLISGQTKLDFYRDIFPEAADLKYVLFPSLKSNRAENFFSHLKVYLLRTGTMDLKRRYGYYQSRNFLRFAASFIINRVLARPSIRKLARFFDTRLKINQAVEQLFDDFSPSLVFLPHLFSDDETAILRVAKRHGVASVGLINSWDKLTSRSIMRLLPDRLIVPSEITRHEAITYHDTPAGKITVSGPSQFDFYKRIAFSDKSVFLKTLGWPEGSRFILFCPMGKTFSDSDWKYIVMLNGCIKEELAHEDLRVLVRFPPNDMVEMEENMDKDRFAFIRPGVRFSTARGLDWDMTERDLQSLADSIHWSELVICPPSSITIDAAILDKPVINMKFDFVSERSYRSVLRFYGSLHYQNIMNLGGIRFVKDRTELLKAIEDYLATPSLDRKGRKKIVHEQVGRADGKAGERIAGTVLDILNKN